MKSKLVVWQNIVNKVPREP